jgi:glyoxylase-like metal-dependent hydrolase (beta-lactamase superfamily II)
VHYQVYALRYAERDTTAGQFFYREPSQERITLHFYVWAILGGPHPVVLDTGFTEEDARRREARGWVSPAEMLARIGLRAAELPLVLVSHLHWDHWDGYRFFPGARFWIQQEEVAFWTGLAGGYATYRQLAEAEALADLVRINYGGRVQLVRGDVPVLPGITAHWVGGHTAGLQVVSVETARGPVVLTSDASHFYRNIERRDPVQIITSLPEMLRGFDRIDALAGSPARVVTGHDPEVARRFDEVEPGIVRIA